MTLLDTFERTFAGVEYNPRRSHLGDAIAQELFEDLLRIDRGHISHGLMERVVERSRVVNKANRARVVRARRGDGTFGEHVPGAEVKIEEGFQVARGPTATVEIGVEVKIIATAMLKQIDRVINDLEKQVRHFRRAGPNAICVGIVGINSAPVYRSFTGGAQVVLTDGRRYRHPVDEAARTQERLLGEAVQLYDEFLILRFRATNQEPFPFEWVNHPETQLDYNAALARISRAYDERFAH